MFESVRRIVGGERSSPFCECRQCGTTIDTAARGCPTCGSAEIACYDL